MPFNSDFYFIRELLEASDEQRFMTDIQKAANLNKRRNVQRVGIESEITSPMDHAEMQEYLQEHGYNSWAAVTDGSIDADSGMRGVELKTNKTISLVAVPAKIDELYNLIGDVDGEINSSCGVHVHFGLSPNINYTVLDLYRLLLTCIERKTEIESAAHRDMGNWARDMRPLINSFDNSLARLKEEKSDTDIKYQDPYADTEAKRVLSIITNYMNNNGEDTDLEKLLDLVLKSVDVDIEDDNFDEKKSGIISMFNKLYDVIENITMQLEITAEDFDAQEDLTQYQQELQSFIKVLSNINYSDELVEKSKVFLNKDIPITPYSSKIIQLIKKIKTHKLLNTEDNIDDFEKSIIKYNNSSSALKIALANNIMRKAIDHEIDNPIAKQIKDEIFKIYKSIKSQYKVEPKSSQVLSVGQEWFTDMNASYYDDRRYFAVNVTNLGNIRKSKYDTYSGGMKHGEFRKYNTVEFRYGDGDLSVEPDDFKNYIKLLTEILEESFTGNTVMKYKEYYLKDISHTVSDSFLKNLPAAKIGDHTGHIIAVYLPKEGGEMKESSLIGYLAVANLYKALDRPRASTEYHDKLSEIKKFKEKEAKDKKLIDSQDVDPSEKGIVKFGEELEEVPEEKEIKQNILNTIKDKKKFKEEVKELLKYAKMKDLLDASNMMHSADLSDPFIKKQVESLKSQIDSGEYKGKNQNKLLYEIKEGKKGDIFNRLQDEYKKNYKSNVLKEKWKSTVAYPSELAKKGYQYARMTNWPENIPWAKITDYNDNSNMITLAYANDYPFLHGDSQIEDPSWEFKESQPENYINVDLPLWKGKRVRVRNALSGEDKQWTYVTDDKYGNYDFLDYNDNYNVQSTFPNVEGWYIELDDEYNNQVRITSTNYSPSLKNKKVKIYKDNSYVTSGFVSDVNNTSIKLFGHENAFGMDEYYPIIDTNYYDKYDDATQWEGKWALNKSWDDSKDWARVYSVSGNKVETDKGTYDLGNGIESDWMISEKEPLSKIKLSDMDMDDIIGQRVSFGTDGKYVIPIKVISPTRMMLSSGQPGAFTELSLTPTDMKWTVDPLYRKYTDINEYVNKYIFRVAKGKPTKNKIYLVIGANADSNEMTVKKVDFVTGEDEGTGTVDFGNGIIPDSDGSFWVVRDTTLDTSYSIFKN